MVIYKTCSEVQMGKVQMGRSEVSTIVVKRSEGLRNKVSIIIRIYTDHMKLYCFFLLSYSFGSILYHCIYGGMFCMLLFNFVYYVFLLLCMFRTRYCVSLCCSVSCFCVNAYCTTATVCQPYFS